MFKKTRKISTNLKCTFSEKRPVRSDLTIQVAHKDDPIMKIICFFPNEPFNGIIQTMQCYNEWKMKKSIIVAKGGFTSSAKQLALDMAPDYILLLCSKKKCICLLLLFCSLLRMLCKQDMNEYHLQINTFH